ncbi:hypothetical protein HanHA300_Chr05g0166141 [Helianthus annuus]|nr:hypothetical protein HanHA300_Chr05g0166141 [Helianthus annuus]KAJ0583742.1 hypothetical protein HanHA89_Chr05g0180141 [Helianthus annuus]
MLGFSGQIPGLVSAGFRVSFGFSQQMGSSQLVSSLFGSSGLVRRSGLVNSVKPSQLGQTRLTQPTSFGISTRRFGIL